MSVLAKRELLVQVSPRYVEGCRHQRRVILDEFVAATGYERKYAIRLLNGPVRPALVVQRRRAPRYGAAVQEALMVVWRAANGICSKRLVPFLPELVPILEGHGHLTLDDEVRTQLLSISAATADRMVRRLREVDRPHGISTTKPGRLLKRQVPVRTFSEWSDLRPGFFEADLVAHCGGYTDGAFLYTLCLTDVATGWTECLPLLHRIPSEVVQAVRQVRRLLPFPLLGFDSDNGHEFINFELVAYCEQEMITFTRGRVANKNDQCFIEQKNGSIVRQLVGYDRFEGQRAYRQLAELYRAVRLYVNFFQPSLKLRTKRRSGAHVSRTYHPAQTPFQRLVASGVLSPTARQRLESIYRALDPVRLLRQLETLQDALWRHAVYRTHGTTVGYAHPRSELIDVTFKVSTHELDGDVGSVANDTPPAARRGAAAPTAHRKYRRTQKSRGPRTYRTRKDPFESVWDEVRGWLEAEPERTVKSVFLQLQDKYPGQYAGCQLRTLHRHVAIWRAGVILTFDEQWLANDAPAGQPLPRPLRASAEPHDDLPMPPEGHSSMTRHQAQTTVRYGSRYASSDTNSTRACLACGTPLTGQRARFCSAASKQLAYRLRRRGDTTPDLPALRQDLQRRRILTTHTIYECPSCGERFVGERRCSSWQLFWRSVGLGGHCSECESPIVFSEVLDNDSGLLRTQSQ